MPISAKCDEDSTNELKIVLRDSLDKHFELSMVDEMTEKEIELLKNIRKSNQTFKVFM